MKISIILPTYNECQCLLFLIPRLEKEIITANLNAEILVVDDNSSDGTQEAIKMLNQKYQNIKLLVRDKKEGLGAALKDAYNFVEGDILLSMDADGQINAPDILKLLSLMDRNDMVIGSKYLANKPVKKVRFLVSKYGNKYLGWITGTHFSDYSLNFRAFKKEVWANINPTDKQNFFLVEMIVQAKRKGYRIEEIPIDFGERHFGKSKTQVWNQIAVFLFKGFLSGIRR